MAPAADHDASPHAPIDHFWAVIPAGGSGTRLWPLSRSARPKFLLPLLGRDSLLQQTFQRVLRLTTPDRVMVVCGPAHAAAVARQLPHLPTENIIVEPSPNGTAPALALASTLIQRRDPRAVMGSFAADHDVTDIDAFCDAVRTAIAAAETGDLVTIGLTPTRPETGYGYIERTGDVRVETSTGTAFRAARFVEKPNLETAQEYLDAGTFLWNASMFFWRVDTFAAELRLHQSAIYEGVRKIARAWESREQERITAHVWATLPNETIDQGIMEHATRVAVVPAEMGWSDVGDWHGLGELIEHDDLGNSVRGDLVQIDTENSVVWSESRRMVATVGLKNIIVVDTDDALLVVDRTRSQDVRKIVDLLKEAMRSRLT
ncbi:MAG TPA: mannose-1-phosphate guanylyltransferase [Thermomicrobiales bacterium]|nr:mannose-1-phosphate guanylyltransferase [Thermomicrobiales bacterium]